MKKLLPTIWVIVLVAGGAIGAPEPSSQPKAKAQAFFDSVTKGKTDKALDVLFVGSPFAESKSDELQRMREDFRKRIEAGEVLGYDLVEEKAFGKSVTRLTYILKLDTLPLVWEFHFYKPKDRWFLARVGFDEDLRKLEGGK